MNILHFRSTNFYGGPERQIHQHAKLAKGSEYTVTLGSFMEGGEIPDLLKMAAEDGISIMTLKGYSAYDPRILIKLVSFIKNKKIDLICSHEYRTSFWCFFASKIAGIPWCGFSRGATRDNARVALFMAIEYFFLQFASRIIAVSNSQRDKLLKKGIPAKKIKVVENATDPALFEVFKPVDLRKRFNIAPGQVVFISGGRFSTEKGQNVLVDAAVRLLEKNNRARFILFGDGPEFSAVKEKIRGLGREEYIICPGFEKNMIGCIKNADFLVNPSLSEGLPNIILEAMAVHTPVIATAVGGVPDLIENGKTGFLVPPNDADALAIAIDKALNADRTIIANAAFTFIEKNYSFKRQFNLLKDVYREFEVFNGNRK
jgi:glycosyltransferase involved in cell wall biosynthesis